MSDKDRMEQEMAEKLTEGEMERLDPERTAVDRLNPRYEIRARTERDPIVEETKKVRQTVKEVDNRYDRFVRPLENEDRREDN
jgi:hypothetical protein